MRQSEKAMHSAIDGQDEKTAEYMTEENGQGELKKKNMNISMKAGSYL